MQRPWFDDGPQKVALLERIKNNLFVEFSSSADAPRKHVGQVMKTIYAGYKVKIPTGEYVNVNPLKDYVREFATTDEYNAAADIWKQEQAVIDAEAARKRQEIYEAQQAVLMKQANCLHEKITEEAVVRVAGCDIDDKVCVDCGKRLERSWSTAYDNDPKSHISDWNWFLRYCHKTFDGYVPKQSDYEIVGSITDEIYR